MMTPPEWTLLIDTSQPDLLLALCDAAGTVKRPNLEGIIAPEAAPNQHASRFFPVLERVLAEANVSLATLPALAINMGPGSFTGLRVGLTFVRMLAQFSPALKAVMPLTAFEVLAATPSCRGQVVDIKLNAYRGRYYHAICRVNALPSPSNTAVIEWVQAPIIVSNDAVDQVSEATVNPEAFLLEDSLVPLLSPLEPYCLTSQMTSEQAEAMAFWVATQPERFLSGSPDDILPQLLPNYMQQPHITVSDKSKLTGDKKCS